jgi:phosphopantothenoylcysteine synthetase/decarboxylase
MRTLISSLKRLYEKEKLTKAQIADRAAKGNISKEEYEYITGEKYSENESASNSSANA